MANKYRNLPISEWPHFEVRWDLSVAGQRFFDDGVNHDKFLESYPRPLKIAWVCLAELDSVLVPASRRSNNEIWTIGIPEKVADIIAYLVDGNSITPPAVAEYHAKLVIVGGHHRLAVCRAKNMETVPVLVEENDAGALAQILKALRWQDAIQ